MVKISRLQRAKTYFLLFLCLGGVLLIFRNELKLLFIPDPSKEMMYVHSFHDRGVSGAKNIITLEGFILENQGLQLSPGSSGEITFSFDKKSHQGCLIRLWFYGDEGNERPNAIKISKDAGRSFKKVAGSGNYNGTVLDLSSYVRGSNNFQILFEAQNYAPFTPVVFDKIEVVIPKGDRVKPQLPNLPKIVGLVLLLFMFFYFALKKDFAGREMLTVGLLMFIMLLATYMRWNELVRVSGTILDGDAKGYLSYAKKMSLFSDNGFYSAQFDLREPLYLFVVKMFFLVFGISDTHLRFVSFIFSLVMVYLIYRIGKEWFNSVVGLTAAFILSVHPYLISLSARGLRAEWFTVLLLLFIYCGYIRTTINARFRIVIVGFLTGCILLTRSECLLMLIIIMVYYPFSARSKWNFRMVLLTLILGISLWVPHLYSTYEKHGDPFYAINKHARFYANREFMGKPGFPTRKEIIEKGLYTGSRITPIEYYFKLHTPWQVTYYSAIGFAKVHINMPVNFALGKGNLRKVMHSFRKLKEDFGRKQIAKTGRLFISILKKDIWDYTLTFAVLTSFLVGLVLIGFSRCWMLYLYMFAFQIQTSFLAYLGIDTRLSVHSYPLIALCCGYTVYWVIVHRRGHSPAEPQPKQL